MGEPGPIGERIKRLRLQRLPALTQRELAERAGISVDVISKLEQGSKQSALLVTLHRIARALDVDISELIVERIPVESDESSDAAGVIAVRRALLDVVDTEPDQPDDVARSVSFAWGAYWNGRYDVLGSALPALVGSARGAHRDAATPETAAQLADACGVTAATLVHLGYVDLAYVAMERALHAAEQGEDALHRAALVGWMSWLLLHYTGTADLARDLAAAEATRLRAAGSDPKSLAVRGSLLVSAAVAAARNEQADVADEFVAEARAEADRLVEMGQPVRRDYESTFGLPQVVMQAVDVAVVTDRPGRALDLAREMSPDAAMPLASRARHLADRAFALVALDRDEAATETLLEIERMAPQWMRYQAYPRATVRELVERERRVRTPRLRELAERLGVVA